MSAVVDVEEIRVLVRGPDHGGFTLNIYGLAHVLQQLIPHWIGHNDLSTCALR